MGVKLEKSKQINLFKRQTLFLLIFSLFHLDFMKLKEGI